MCKGAFFATSGVKTCQGDEKNFGTTAFIQDKNDPCVLSISNATVCG